MDPPVARTEIQRVGHGRTLVAAAAGRHGGLRLYKTDLAALTDEQRPLVETVINA
ncbi:hypothetical protein AB0B60_41830 [Streptomyces lincolnensis]|uniref:hypothetical protein n=1 Tax=Streptomyces lincolnensis TaxID=1915 RepID=UPI0013520D97|nr:hypothetical protein [Streptomyces lincolnensis]